MLQKLLEGNDIRETLLTEKELWIKRAKVKPEPTATGVFASADPKKISAWALKDAGGDVGEAIKKIVFYVNRAGDKLPADQKSACDAAVKILQG